LGPPPEGGPSLGPTGASRAYLRRGLPEHGGCGRAPRAPADGREMAAVVPRIAPRWSAERVPLPPILHAYGCVVDRPGGALVRHADHQTTAPRGPSPAISGSTTNSPSRSCGPKRRMTCLPASRDFVHGSLTQDTSQRWRSPSARPANPFSSRAHVARSSARSST
jgi:hypothetical protein